MSIPESVRLETISEQDMADGARLERCWRELSDPLLEMYRSGVAVDRASQWVFAENYVDPGFLFVPREGAQQPSDPLDGRISDLRGVVRKAHHAERHRSARAKGASFECFCRFRETSSALETEVWTVWRERWRLMQDTRDAACLYELVGDAWRLCRMGLKLRLVAAAIMTRKLGTAGSRIVAWRRTHARIAESARRIQARIYLSRAIKSVSSISSALDITLR